MRALVYNNKLELHRAYPEPQVVPGEAVIRVLLAGICNTDLEVARGYMGFRGVLGHEFVGVVEGAPDPARIGQRVVGEINCACGECPTCRRGDGMHCPTRTTLGLQGRDGALADLCRLPLRNLHRVPDELCNEQAVFVEPLAAALEITERIHIRPTDHVIVIGDGKLGLLTAQVLRLTGCELQVIGRHSDKLSILRKHNVRTLLEADVPAGLQSDIVVDCTGHQDGFTLARHLVRPRGTLVLKSTFYGDGRINLSSLVVDEISLIGSRCGPFAPALRLLAQGLIDVESLIDSTYPLDDGLAAFERATTRGVLKVLVKP
ncbi:MAG: alcohol dehydrogenase catalytic domain-containing protein [Anaerolineae bacterium]|nr:alcohol dehydrogenase catalytic domain-containing protein [Anaerolineae bacterium]